MRVLSHVYRRSSSVVRVLDVRIDWHVKRPTSNKVKRRAVRRQADRGALEQRAAYACGPHGVPQEFLFFFLLAII